MSVRATHLFKKCLTSGPVKSKLFGEHFFSTSEERGVTLTCNINKDNLSHNKIKHVSRIAIKFRF